MIAIIRFETLAPKLTELVRGDGCVVIVGAANMVAIAVVAITEVQTFITEKPMRRGKPNKNCRGKLLSVYDEDC